jgi:hypothetical protein
MCRKSCLCVGCERGTLHQAHESHNTHQSHSRHGVMLVISDCATANLLYQYGTLNCWYVALPPGGTCIFIRQQQGQERRGHPAKLVEPAPQR